MVPDGQSPQSPRLTPRVVTMGRGEAYLDWFLRGTDSVSVSSSYSWESTDELGRPHQCPCRERAHLQELVSESTLTRGEIQEPQI